MFKSLLQKIKEFLTQGITPHKLALTFAAGVCLGTIPLLGTTTLLCLAASLAFRLNVPILQIVNNIVYPLQLLLFIPFLKTGASLFSDQPFNYTLSQIMDMFSNDPWHAISALFLINMYGLALWLACCPLIFAAVYFSSKGILGRAMGNGQCAMSNEQ